MCATLLIAGCQALPRAGSDTGQSESDSNSASLPTHNQELAPGLQEGNQLIGLIAYTNWLHSRNPGQLRRLVPDAEARVKHSDNDLNRLRLAVLLSLPQASFRNDGRARELVDEVLGGNTPRDGDLAVFATMLHWELRNREFLQGEFARSLTEERERRAALKQKLNELKAIEEQIHRRETKAPSTTP